MEETTDLSVFVRGAIAGSREDFARLYELSSDKVFRFLLGQLRDRESALDTLQEVYIDLWKQLPKFQYRGEGEWWGFIFTIARRKVYKARRERERANIAVPNETLEFLHESGTPFTLIDGDERVLHNALAKLSTLSREILDLRYWSELSYKEISLALGTTEGAAKVRHHRAIKELQAYLPNTYAEQ